MDRETAMKLKMHGIKTVASETKSLRGYYSPEYLQLFYDKSEDRVWTVFHVSIGHDEWTKYHDDEIVNCGNIYSPKTMKEIREKVAEYLYFE